MEYRVVHNDILTLPTFTRVEVDDPRLITQPVNNETLVSAFDDTTSVGFEEKEFGVVHDFVSIPVDVVGSSSPSRYDGITLLQVGGQSMYVNMPYETFVEVIAGERTHVQLQY